MECAVLKFMKVRETYAKRRSIVEFIIQLFACLPRFVAFNTITVWRSLEYIKFAFQPWRICNLRFSNSDFA